MSIDSISFDDDFSDFDVPGFDSENFQWLGHNITWEDIPAIQEAVISRIQTWLFSQNTDDPTYLAAVSRLALIGATESPNRIFIERDVLELIDSPEGLQARGRDGVIVPAKFLKKACKFVRKHKTAIIVGTVIVGVAITAAI